MIVASVTVRTVHSRWLMEKGFGIHTTPLPSGPPSPQVPHGSPVVASGIMAGEQVKENNKKGQPDDHERIKPPPCAKGRPSVFLLPFQIPVPHMLWIEWL